MKSDSCQLHPLHTVKNTYVQENVLKINVEVFKPPLKAKDSLASCNQ